MQPWLYLLLYGSEVTYIVNRVDVGPCRRKQPQDPGAALIVAMSGFVQRRTPRLRTAWPSV